MKLLGKSFTKDGEGYVKLIPEECEEHQDTIRDVASQLSNLCIPQLGMQSSTTAFE
jgi:hypothetical protein